MSPLVGGFYGTPGQPFSGHPVDEESHILASGGVSATPTPARQKVGLPGGNKAGGGANNHPQYDNALFPWGLARTPCSIALSFIL